MKEYLLFPKTTYYLTQAFGKGTYSHVYRKAIDVSASGKGGSKKIYAPFTGTIKNKYVDKKGRYASTCWIVSDNKVICADGVERYAVMMLTHPNGINNLKIGQKFKQWDYMFDDGTTGGVSAHVDIEVAIYDSEKDIKASWYQVQDGSYELYNAVDPFKTIVMKDDCKVLNDVYQGKTYTFKKVSEVKVKPSEDYFVPNKSYKLLYDKYLRSTPSLGDNIVKYSTLDSYSKKICNNVNGKAQLKKGTVIEPLKIHTEANGRIWASYGNCWWCCQNVDGTKQAEKIN